MRGFTMNRLTMDSSTLKRLTLLLALAVAFNCATLLARESGGIGLKVDVKASGFFKPTIDSAKVAEVVSGSPAYVAGVAVGDNIIAIDGCAIPGCPAKNAKAAMAKSDGEVIELTLKADNAAQRTVKVVTN